VDVFQLKENQRNKTTLTHATGSYLRKLVKTQRGCNNGYGYVLLGWVSQIEQKVHGVSIDPQLNIGVIWKIA
jgi:hypothetical protein